MQNNIITNTTAPANGPALLSRLKVTYPASTVKAFEAFTAEYSRICSEMDRFTPEAAAAEANLFRERAEKSPTSENLKALAGAGREEIERRFKTAYENLSRVRYVRQKAAAPVTQEIAAVALKAVDAELEKLDKVRREQADFYGVPYERNADPLISAIVRFRYNAASSLANNAVHLSPGRVVKIFGEIRAK